MTKNPLFTSQTTLEKTEGSVWRLPLINLDQDENEVVENSEEIEIRNPLSTPLQEIEDNRRLEEGRSIVNALFIARNEAIANGDDFLWSDVMLLVRHRTHLSAYETALREAGIPFISSRRGGLLDALEVADVIALLKFLITPGDNQALAHVLKSPIISAGDDDLIELALRSESSWWKRLLASYPNNIILERAVKLLTQWMDATHFLPVHDLLDRILHQGELVQRYAQHASYASRNQVIGNLAAFTELALNMDAGRYPSLPKFIAMLSEYQSSNEGDAPDESQVESSADAVRILTIHSAKGLEAKIVVLVDANHSEEKKDSLGILCEWPLDEIGQKHFSVFGRKNQRGAARDALFRQEEELAQQENWNLLYVAMTRTKQLLIVSGIVGKGKANSGSKAVSWYDRLQDMVEFDVTQLTNSNIQTTQLTSFELSNFVPPVLSLPASEVNFKLAKSNTVAQSEGIALHSLMERLTGSLSSWPIRIPEAVVISKWLSCSVNLANLIREQAQTILHKAELERYFNPACFRFARNEMDIVTKDKLLRLDRVVVFDDAVWVLDFKRQLLETERLDYQDQLKEYSAALRQIYNKEKIYSALILADGSLIEMEIQGNE